MTCLSCSKSFTIIHLSIESCLLATAVMILQINSAILGEHGAVHFSSDETTNKAVLSLLWLYTWVLIIRNIVGWVAVAVNGVIYYFLYQIMTGVVLFMHSVVAIYGLGMDHEAVLMTSVICFTIEIPTFVTSNVIVQDCRASIRGKAQWEKIFGEQLLLDHTRRSTIA